MKNDGVLRKMKQQGASGFGVWAKKKKVNSAKEKGGPRSREKQVREREDGKWSRQEEKGEKKSNWATEMPAQAEGERGEEIKSHVPCT